MRREHGEGDAPGTAGEDRGLAAGIRPLAVLVVVAAIVTGVGFFVPVEDPDVFWHLKTGEWIWQHGALPAHDPFGYTAPGAPLPEARFTLTSYWLSQVVLWLAFSAAGFPGIIALRFAVLALLTASLVLRRRRSDPVILTGLIVVALTVLRLYSPERPQFASFVCFSVLWGLLAAFRTSAGRPALVALLMLAWSNLHAAALPGQALIVGWLALEGAKHLHPGLRPLPREQFRRLVIAGLAGLAASLLNPNTFHGLARLLAPATAGHYNIEYESTLHLFRDLGLHRIAGHWVVLALAAAGFALRRRQVDFTEAVLLLGIGAVSCARNRYVPFLLAAAVPVVAAWLSAGGLRERARLAVFCIALGTGAYFSWQGWDQMLDARAGRWISPSFPEDQADFLATSDLKGNLYNDWTWGGYLLWRLAPARRVFADGRTLNPKAIELANAIDSGAPEAATGDAVWKKVFEAYGVGFTLTPTFLFSGELHPLVRDLARNPGWVPVSGSLGCVVFARWSPENAPVIARSGMPSAAFLSALLAQNETAIAAFPGSALPLWRHGELLAAAGRTAEARAAYARALALEPSGPVAQVRRASLERRRVRETQRGR